VVLGGYILEFLGSAGRLVGVLWWGRNWGRDYFSTQGTSRGARFAFAFARGLLSKMAIDGCHVAGSGAGHSKLRTKGDFARFEVRDVTEVVKKVVRRER